MDEEAEVSLDGPERRRKLTKFCQTATTVSADEWEVVGFRAG